MVFLPHGPRFLSCGSHIGSMMTHMDGSSSPPERSFSPERPVNLRDRQLLKAQCTIWSRFGVCSVMHDLVTMCLRSKTPLVQYLWVPFGSPCPPRLSHVMSLFLMFLSVLLFPLPHLLPPMAGSPFGPAPYCPTSAGSLSSRSNGAARAAPWYPPPWTAPRSPWTLTWRPHSWTTWRSGRRANGVGAPSRAHLGAARRSQGEDDGHGGADGASGESDGGRPDSGGGVGRGRGGGLEGVAALAENVASLAVHGSRQDPGESRAAGSSLAADTQGKAGEETALMHARSEGAQAQSGSGHAEGQGGHAQQSQEWRTSKSGHAHGQGGQAGGDADVVLWPMLSRSLGGRVHILLLPLVTAEQYVRFVSRPVLGVAGPGPGGMFAAANGSGLTAAANADGSSAAAGAGERSDIGGAGEHGGGCGAGASIHERLAMGTMAASSCVLSELTSVTGGISLLNTLAELLPWEQLDYGTHAGPGGAAASTPGGGGSSGSGSGETPSPGGSMTGHAGGSMGGNINSWDGHGGTPPVGMRHGSPAPLPPRGGESGGKRRPGRREDGAGDGSVVAADGSGSTSSQALEAIVAAAPPVTSAASSKVMRMAEAAVRSPGCHHGPSRGSADHLGPGLLFDSLADPLSLLHGWLHEGLPSSSSQRGKNDGYQGHHHETPGIHHGPRAAMDQGVHESLATPGMATPIRGRSANGHVPEHPGDVIGTPGAEPPGSTGAAGGLDPVQVRALRQHIEAFVASALPFGTPLETHLGHLRECMARGFPTGKVSEQSQRQPAWKPYPYREGGKQRLSFLVRETVHAAVNIPDPHVTDASGGGGGLNGPSSIGGGSVGAGPPDGGRMPLVQGGRSLTSSSGSFTGGLLSSVMPDRSVTGGGGASVGGAAVAAAGPAGKVTGNSIGAGDVVAIQIAGSVECTALLHGLPDVTAVLQQQRPDFEPPASWARAVQQSNVDQAGRHSEQSSEAITGPSACIVTDLLLHPCVQSSDVRPGHMERVPLCFSPPLGPFCLARYSVPCRSQSLAGGGLASSLTSSVSSSSDRLFSPSIARADSMGRDQGSPGMGLPLPSPSPPSRIPLLSTSPGRASFLTSNPLLKSTPPPSAGMTPQVPTPLALPVSGSYQVDLSCDGDATVASVQLHLNVWEGFQGTLEELLVELPFPPSFGHLAAQGASVPFGSTSVASAPGGGGEHGSRDTLVWKAPGPRNVRAKNAKMSLTATVRFLPPGTAGGPAQAQGGDGTPGGAGQAWGGSGGGKGRSPYLGIGAEGGNDGVGRRDVGRVSGLPAKLTFRLLGKSFTGMSMDVKSIEVYPPPKPAVGPDVMYEVVSGQYVIFSA
eukprot:jgi/Mesvir1/5122/Mv15278-RA.3